MKRWSRHGIIPSPLLAAPKKSHVMACLPATYTDTDHRGKTTGNLSHQGTHITSPSTKDLHYLGQTGLITIAWPQWATTHKPPPLSITGLSFRNPSCCSVASSCCTVTYRNNIHGYVPHVQFTSIIPKSP